MTSRSKTRDRDKHTKELNNLSLAAHKAAKVIGIDSIKLLDYPDNRMDSVDLLDIVKTVENFVDKIKPNIVLTHHSGDLNIDGSLDAPITIPDSADWDFGTSAYAVSAWIYVPILTELGSTYAGLIGARGSSNGTGWELKTNGADKLVWFSAGEGAEIASGTALTQGQWYHVVAGRSASSTKTDIFINGIVENTMGNTNSIQNDGNLLRIGQENNAGAAYRYKGFIDEIMIVNGSSVIPRFYLGNQTAESVTTTSNVKYADFNGTIDIEVQVSDGDLSDSQTFSLTVTPVNDPMVFEPIDNQIIEIYFNKIYISIFFCSLRVQDNSFCIRVI